MNKYVTLSNVNVNSLADWEYAGIMMHVVPDWHSNVVANGYVWFLTVTNNNDFAGHPHRPAPLRGPRQRRDRARSSTWRCRWACSARPACRRTLIYGQEHQHNGDGRQGQRRRRGRRALAHRRLVDPGPSIQAPIVAREQDLLRHHAGDHLRHRRQRQGGWTREPSWATAISAAGADVDAGRPLPSRAA